MAAEHAGPGSTADAAGGGTKPEDGDRKDRTPRVVTSESLLAGAPQLAILHDRTLSFLRETRCGKLILTR